MHSESHCLTCPQCLTAWTVHFCWCTSSTLSVLFVSLSIGQELTDKVVGPAGRIQSSITLSFGPDIIFDVRGWILATSAIHGLTIHQFADDFWVVWQLWHMWDGHFLQCLDDIYAWMLGCRVATHLENLKKWCKSGQGKVNENVFLHVVNYPKYYYWYKMFKKLRKEFLKVLHIQCESKKSPPPCSFLTFFPKRLGISTHLLSVHIYARLQIFIQLSPILTKLCHTKRDHPSNFWHFIRT